jgi:hypothetical protein
MNKKRYLDRLISDKNFYFRHLTISGIDNTPVARVFSDTVLEQEVCLFSRDIETGDAYFRFLHQRMLHALQNKQPLPIARFADGEYAFYNYTLGCNGLYKQAESVAAIRKVMPRHIDAMHFVADHGFLAPLVYPGNANAVSTGLLSFFTKKPDTTGADFLDFIEAAKMELTGSNYIPFYLVYAYLTSADFIRLMNGKNLVILNSDFNEKSCRDWFMRYDSRPEITFVNIPAEYVATRWDDAKEQILKRIPRETDLCLAGAGVGALLIVHDAAQSLSIPAMDAGHVLNLMNDRADKSNGVRLYTLRKEQ